MPAPLYVKYETEKTRYLFDAATGRIIEVDPVIYTVVDDMDVFTDDELIDEYPQFDEKEIRTALSELRGLQSQGYLRPHQPKELSSVERVVYDRTLYRIGDFWPKRSMLLILGITERCNLCCDYCCYSGKFEGQRTHSSKTMSWEIAQKAISYYLENEQVGDGTCPITFYGGEPLLEFKLLQKSVLYAEELAASLGKQVRFAITTNGTLLSDEAADFLAEHDFMILVSMDGPKESHDRYRIFVNGEGSFEIVKRNLQRFAERHPGYVNRGLSVTLAPPFDLETTGRFIEEMYQEYPLSRVNFVNTGPEYQLGDKGEISTFYGCHSKAPCNPNSNVDGFRVFRNEDRKAVIKLWDRCMESIASVGAIETREIMPFAMLLFESQISFYHRRNVMDNPPDWSIYVPCIPGFTRRFCDVDGNYRVCERVDDSAALLLGNVWDGPDVTKMKRTMEMRRHFGDCANCQTLGTCSVCYARISSSDAAANGFDPYYDTLCQTSREAMIVMLRAYTTIMERNPKAFDGPLSNDNPAFQKVRFVEPEKNTMSSIRETLLNECLPESTY